jgi:hypothetical protein
VAARSRPAAAVGGGGLGDILGQVLGGGVPARGLAELEAVRARYGARRDPVGTAQNLPLPPDALEKVLGAAASPRLRAARDWRPGRLARSVAAHTRGRRSGDAGGQVPAADSLMASVDAWRSARA